MRAFLAAALLALLAACATPPSAPTEGPAAPQAEPPVAATPAAQPASAASKTAPTTAVQAAAPAQPAASQVAAPAEVAVARSATAAEPPASQASATPTDPLRPEVPVDLDDSSARLDLWDRVRGGFAMPELDSELVRRHEQWYSQRPDYVQRMMERGSRYLYHVVEEVTRRGMPTELALLPFIESAFNPQAMSIAKASGMWQFMPATGRHFELAQNVFRDDRRHVLASTNAALDYLARLHGMFGDWHLALAAYNWGEGNVRRAIVRNQKRRLPTHYESLRMPAETRSYVPKLQAVKNIVLRPSDFALELPALANHPYFLTVPIERDIDVALAARLADLTEEAFHELNPQLNQPVILAAGTPKILLPYDNADLFVRNLDAHTGPLASWTAWVVPKTMRPSEAARKVGITEEDLRELNRIPLRMLVRAGSTLLVPRNGEGHTDVSSEIADNAMILLAPDRPPGRRVVLKVGKKGDTVRNVARRYRLDIGQVAQWNSVAPDARFRAGAHVIVYVPHKAKAVKSSVRPTKKVTAKRPRR